MYTFFDLAQVLSEHYCIKTQQIWLKETCLKSIYIYAIPFGIASDTEFTHF